MNGYCHADTCVPHEIRDEWILIGGHSWCEKMCPLIRGIHIFKSWWILVLFSKIYYFYTYIWGSQGKWKSLVEDIGVTLDKEKKERNDVKLLQLEVF